MNNGRSDGCEGKNSIYNQYETPLLQYTVSFQMDCWWEGLVGVAFWEHDFISCRSETGGRCVGTLLTRDRTWRSIGKETVFVLRAR